MADQFARPEGGDLATYQAHQQNAHDNMGAYQNQLGSAQSHGNESAGSNLQTGETRQER